MEAALGVRASLTSKKFMESPLRNQGMKITSEQKVVHPGYEPLKMAMNCFMAGESTLFFL